MKRKVTECIHDLNINGHGDAVEILKKHLD